jgi:hypothetical protein
MAESETTPPAGASVDPIDQISELLIGGPDEEAETSPDQETEAGAVEEIEEDDESDQSPEDSASDDEEQGEEAAQDDEEDDRSLATLLGLDESQVTVNEETGDLLLNTKVDGEVSALNFKEVMSGYQSQKFNTQRSQALVKERQEFDGIVQQAATRIKAGLEMNQALTQKLQNELLSEFSSTNWDELRQTDPAEYAARQQDQSVRYNQLQGVQRELQEHAQQQAQELEGRNTAARQDYLNDQREVMLSNNPDWHDPTVMKSNVGAIREFMRDTYGFSDDDIAMLGDARAVQVLQDAMSYRKGKTVVQKKIKAVPKMQKSKGVKRKRVSKLDRLTKAAKSASGGDRRSLQVDAVAELLTGG